MDTTCSSMDQDCGALLGYSEPNLGQISTWRNVRRNMRQKWSARLPVYVIYLKYEKANFLKP